MRKYLVVGVFILILAVSLISFGPQVFAQSVSPTPAPMVNATSAAGQTSVLSPNALTSFTISNPYCYQPDPAVDQCVVNFRYIQATDNQSAAPYMTWLAITISGKKRYVSTAFFEGTIYYSYDMNPIGMKVPCGAPNAGGAGTQFGNVFGVTVQPLDSSRNPMSTDIANVTCPAFTP